MAGVDPITVEVIGNNFTSIAQEMDITLVKTSYSTNVKERRDCSCALLDSNGLTITQAENAPLHMGSMLGLVDEIHKRYSASDIHPGDVFIANDPYSGGGTHLPDITVAAPFFCEGKLIAFATNIAHHSDVGGARVLSIDIWSEGLRIPPIKIFERGKLRQDLYEFILLNCRMEDERRGDLRAQFASLQTGLSRLQALGEKYGADALAEAIVRLADQAELQARAGVRSIPPGRYEFVDLMDDDGVGEEPVRIQVAVTVEGDGVTCDFTGSSPQVSGNINISPSALRASVYYAIKAVIDPTLPPNGGFYRTINVIAPEGSVVSCVPPASVRFRSDTAQRIVDTILGALARAVPGRIPAACHSTVSSMQFYGKDPRTGATYGYPEVVAGGYGARPNSDGPDAVQVHITNTSNLPVEALEPEYPILVERYELVPNSGGAGKYRGGLGLLRQYRVLGDEARFRSHGDRHKLAPWGLHGGHPGGKGTVKINPDTPEERTAGSKTQNITLKKGDRARICTPGGGGYGDPLERDRSVVERDLRDGKITPDEAVSSYGWDLEEASRAAAS